MKTLLTIKTEKSLKDEAKKIAEEFGIPLSTLINVFLKQFVRDKELSISLSYKPTKYLADIITESEAELNNGLEPEFMSADDFIVELKKLQKHGNRKI